MMAHRSESDDHLVAAARDARDVVAFAELVRRYQSATFAVALSVVGDRQLAEDAAQETFLHAWASFDRLRDPSRVAPWLCGIARNIARGLVRGRAREVIDDEPEIESDATPLREMMEREADQALSQLLGRVPDRYRAPMVLHYQAEQSVAQIAQCLDLSEPNVKKLLSRGREMLRERAQRFTELASACRVPATLAVAVIAAVGARSAAAASTTATAGAMTTLVKSGVAVKKSLLIAAVVACLLSLLGYRLLRDRDDAVASTPVAAPTPVETTARAPAAHPQHLAGVVVDDRTSAPLAGATVLATRAIGGPLATTIAEHQQPPAVVVTDANGRFAFDLAPGEFHVDANLAGYTSPAPASVEIATADVAGVELRLSPGGVRVHGTVSDIKGGPVAAAIVTAQAAAIPLGKAKAAITRSDGSYELWLDAGSYELRAEHVAYAPATAQLAVSRDVDRDLQLVPASYIEGVVLDRRDARPIAGAIVFVDDKEELAAITDAEGRFRLEQLAAGSFALRARAPRAVTLTPSVVDLDIGQTRSGVELWLDRGADVSGRVVDDAGKPVAGAAVGVLQFTDGTSYEADAPTDAAGRFVVHGVAPGSYGAAVQARQRPLLLRRTGIEVADRDVANVELVVTSAHRVIGKVVPARPATIRLARAGGTPLAGLALGDDLSDFLNLEAATTRTRGDGSFEIASAPPGTYTLVALADDGTRGEAPVTVAHDDAVTVSLADTPTVRGTLVDRHGKPIAGVGLHVASSHYYPEQGVDAVTDASGAFAIRGLPPGGYDVSLVDARCQRTLDDATLAIADKPAAPRLVASECDHTVRGVVVDKRGARVADAWVHVDSEDFTSPALLTDADGRFAATGLHPGPFTITAYHPTLGRARVDAAAPDTDLAIELHAETALQVTVTRHGAPVVGYELQLHGGTDRSLRSRTADGTLTVGNLTPARYTVTVTTDDGAATAEVTLAADATRTLALELQPWASVRGVLVGADRRPLAGHVVMPVEAHPDQTPDPRAILGKLTTATTDRDGHFELRRVPASDNALVVSSPNGDFTAVAFQVAPGEQRDLGTVTATFER